MIGDIGTSPAQASGGPSSSSSSKAAAQDDDLFDKQLTESA